MTEEEKDLSVLRMKRDGRDATGHWTVDVLRQVIRSWQFYAFVIGWACVHNSILSITLVL